jgi:short-subunit dehydrogenase
VVTGASSGIGRALARQLCDRGQPVLAVARRGDRLEALAAEVRAAGSAPVHVLPLDVTAPDAGVRVRDRARVLGGATWLVNDAGSMHVGRFELRAAAEAASEVRLNCESLVAMTAAVLPDLVAAGRGVVLNVASLSGFQPTPGYAVYGACKAFVLSFSEGLAEELRGSGVTVTALSPGPVTTDLFAPAPGVERRRRPTHELTAEDCARFGIEAAMRGQTIAIPGLWNRLQVWGARLIPRAVVRRAAARGAVSDLGLPPLPARPDGRQS